MRLAFARALTNQVKKNSKIHLLTGDLGFQVFESFQEKFPNNFTNAGVAEANMVGMAAGMAHMGLSCVCYSIAPFLVFRAFEQIRNDVCYHKLDVKIVGVGGGYGYSLNGQSHCAVEDIAVMRALPKMTVVCPGDPLEAYMATVQMLKIKGPVYLRLGKKGEQNIMYEQIGQFKIGRVVEVNKGESLVIFSTGNMLETAVEVIERLERKKLKPTLIHVHTVKPLDEKKIVEVIKSHERMVTIEEHSVVGGLGSAISELSSTSEDLHKELLMIGVGDEYVRLSGYQSYLRKSLGMDVEGIERRVRKWLG